MSQPVLLEDRGRAVESSSFPPREAVRYLYSNYLMWFHAGLALIFLTLKGGLLIYGPTVIKNLVFDKIKANILASVSNFALVALAVIAAWVSDKTRLRGPICFICTAYALIMAGVQYAVTLTDKWAKYAVFVIFMAGNATFQGINSAWLSANVRDAKGLCISQALVVIGVNLSGLAGQQLFRDEDAPQYGHGFLSIMCLYVATLVFVVILTFVYWRKDRNLVTVARNVEEVGTEQNALEEANYQI